MQKNEIANKQFSRDLILMLFSNGVTLAGSIVSGMLIPKILGVEEFSFYNIYTLYLTYTAMLHFGFVDGILLKFAGKEYKTLVNSRFRAYSKFYFRFQLIIAAMILLVAVFLPSPYRLVFIFIGIDTLAINLTSYYQYVSQDTMRFKELSIRKVLQALLKIILAFALWFMIRKGMVESNYAIIYIIGIIVIDLLLALWYTLTYREITFGQSDRFTDAKKDILKLFREGIFLTLAYWLCNLLYTLDRQVVSIAFDSYTYGIYSFANRLIATASGFVLAVALVLFPRLKRLSQEKIIETFPVGMSAISAAACFALVFYQPLVWIINKFLGEYTESVIYLKILFPALVFMCCINIIIYTYFNALNRQRIFFAICCMVLAVAVGINAIAVFAFHASEYVSCALVVSLLILYMLGVLYYAWKYKVRWVKNFVYIMILIAGYYMTAFFINNAWLSCAVYAGFYIVITLIFFYSYIRRKLGH